MSISNFGFNNSARGYAKLNREDVRVWLGRHATASLGAGGILTITPPDGGTPYIAQIKLGHRREMAAWCNEFNRRTHIPAYYTDSPETAGKIAARRRENIARRNERKAQRAARGEYSVFGFSRT